MDLNLNGRIALVTGGSRGLGFACAEALVREGVKVAISSHTNEALETATRLLSRIPQATVAPFNADLRVVTELESLAAQVRERLGSIDILVLSAPHPPAASFLNTLEGDWQRGVESLIRPAAILSQLLTPDMKLQNYGRLIYIGSVFGLEPEPTSVVQSTFRAGLNALAKCISSDVAPYGITANVVCPGYFDTPLVSELATQKASSLGNNRQVKRILRDWQTAAPSRRFGDPKELGALVAFLASPLAGFIQGTSLQIDGGLLHGY